MNFYIFDSWDFGATHLVGVRASSQESAMDTLRSHLDARMYPGYADDMLRFEGECTREEYLAADERY